VTGTFNEIVTIYMSFSPNRPLFLRPISVQRPLFLVVYIQCCTTSLTARTELLPTAQIQSYHIPILTLFS